MQTLAPFYPENKIQEQETLLYRFYDLYRVWMQPGHSLQEWASVTELKRLRSPSETWMGPVHSEEQMRLSSSPCPTSSTSCCLLLFLFGVSSRELAFLILIGCTKNCSTQNLLHINQIENWKKGSVLNATPTLQTWILNWGFSCHHYLSSWPPHHSHPHPATPERDPFLPWAGIWQFMLWSAHAGDSI